MGTPTTRWRPAPLWASVAGLAWCGLAGWIAFVADGRVPLLGYVNLGFHELGHLVMYAVPVSELATAAMGSVLQCAVPLALAAYFALRRRDLLAAGVCLAWAATNFAEVATYVADAPYERLTLIGGEHDWAFILGPDQLDRLDAAAQWATATRAVGVVVLLAATACCVTSLLGSGAARSRLAWARPGTTTPSAPSGRV